MYTARRRILDTFDEMFSLLPNLLPENQPFALRYLEEVWRPTTTFVEPIVPVWGRGNAGSKFKKYVDAEHERIQTNLEAISYDIDEIKTVELIAGSGRIEKVFDLLYCFETRLTQTQSFFPL